MLIQIFAVLRPRIEAEFLCIGGEFGILHGAVERVAQHRVHGRRQVGRSEEWAAEAFRRVEEFQRQPVVGILGVIDDEGTSLKSGLGAAPPYSNSVMIFSGIQVGRFAITPLMLSQIDSTSPRSMASRSG
jgi:hypothetical protein